MENSNEGKNVTSVSSEKVTELSQVELPKTALNGVAHDGAGKLLQEVMDAVRQGGPQNDHLPLQQVIGDWHANLLMRQSNPQRYEELVDRARRSHPNSGLTDEEEKPRLGLAS